MLAAASVFAAAPQERAGGADPGYCDPAASALDPPDVPPGGSAPVEVDGVRTRSIALNGVKTRLLTAGPPNASTAVVFLHGSPGSSSDWARLLPLVAGRNNRAVAFDLPGFGHAEDAWGGDPTLDAGVAVLGDALRQLHIRRVHLVAHDISGPLGLEWGARHPKRLRSVTLFDTGLLFNYRHHMLAQISRTPGGGEAFWAGLNRQSFSAGIQDGQTRPLPAEFVNRLYDDLDRETRCAIIALYRGTDEPEIHRFARRQAKVLRRRADRPALVIWGEDDPYLPAETAQQQRRGFPGARIKVFPQAGHWPFVDYPRRSRKLIVRFLRNAVKRDTAVGRR
jgi:pimeloyl-ACP methyl ester carboxylesterase